MGEEIRSLVNSAPEYVLEYNLSKRQLNRMYEEVYGDIPPSGLSKIQIISALKRHFKVLDSLDKTEEESGISSVG